jgi:hypothetical protein
MDKIHATGSVIASQDFPDELKAVADDDSDLWAYATVEVEDLDKDVIRVDGLSLKAHTDANPIKILATHKRDIGVDGFPVVGKATRFAKVAHKGTGAPALAFGMKFAPTPFGKVMKSLYDGGFLSEFSIGARPKRGDPLGRGKGMDYKEAELFEISACTVARNPLASVMRSMLDEEEKDDNLSVTVKTDPALLAALAEVKKSYVNILVRMDDLESAIVAKSHEAEQTGDHQPPQPSPDLSNIAKALQSLLAKHTK